MLTLSRGARAIGTFVKTDSTQVVEILGLCKLDFCVLDCEHAPFDRATMDRMLLAARACLLPMLVRVADQRDAGILSALDLGASGVIVPHVDCAEQARDVLAAARFIGGRRGLSLSARFAGYGTQPRDAAIAQADRTLVICQIESGAALAEVEAIAAVPGLSGLLIGRADLAMSMGLPDTSHPAVTAASRRIAAAGAAQGLPVMLACGSMAEAGRLSPLGEDACIIGSDQSLLRDAARMLAGARVSQFEAADVS